MVCSYCVNQHLYSSNCCTSLWFLPPQSAEAAFANPSASVLLGKTESTVLCWAVVWVTSLTSSHLAFKVWCTCLQGSVSWHYRGEGKGKFAIGANTTASIREWVFRKHPVEKHSVISPPQTTLGESSLPVGTALREGFTATRREGSLACRNRRGGFWA